MRGNSGGKCSDVTVMVSGTVVMSPCSGTKGVFRHVSTPKLKSIMELRKSV